LHLEAARGAIRAVSKRTAIGLLAAACAGPAQAPPPPPAVEVGPAGGTREPPAPRRERSGAAQPVLIDAGGVGDVRIGEPIPAHHLLDDREARSRYEIRWVADAQPFEAFRIGEARVIASFRGPFTRWAESNAGELDPARFVERAIRDARGSAPVESIVVDTPGPATAARIGVGSSYSNLIAAHPTAKIVRLPEWFESRPTCQVEIGELPRITFHLSACGAEQPGSVIRVLVSPAQE
jgi:hypothetical protein